MSEYTPTTEEVRDSYRFSNKRPDICGKDFGAEFDRWLAKRDAEVAAKAWDQGNRAGAEHARSFHLYQQGGLSEDAYSRRVEQDFQNPHRKEQDDE